MHLLPDWIIDPNSDRINFHEPFELDFWISQWNTTRADLVVAKNSSGSSIVNSVYAELIRLKLIHGISAFEDKRTIAK